MLSGENTSLEVKHAILSYLKGKLDAVAISTATTTLAVRQVLPTCPLTDRELADVIAETAIEAGFAVSFEHASPPSANDNTGTTS
jgi:hypothetical protein